MENASKALIIAGAILVSILIIGLGMALINAVQEPMAEAEGQMTQQALRQFNDTFLKYGGKQKGSAIRSMISEVIASNAKETKNGTNRTITVNTKTTAADISNTATSVVNSKEYTVTFGYDTNGAVNSITFN